MLWNGAWPKSSPQARPWSFMISGGEGSIWGGGLVWISGLWICGCVMLLWNPRPVVVVVAKDWFGVVGYGFVGVMKPRSVVVLAMLLWWSPQRSLSCEAQIGPHSEASGSGCCKASGSGFVGVVKPRLIPTTKPHLYLSSILLSWEFW